MTLAKNLKQQITSISQKVAKAEKIAEKQILQAVKSTETFRNQQMKNAHALLKKARALKQADLVKNAEKVKKDLEGRAVEGVSKIFAKLNLPSRKEIDRLNKKISTLQKRLDEVEKKKA